MSERLGSAERCPEPWREGAPRGYAVLAELLRDVRFRPGWAFHLMTYGSETVLGVEIETVNTYHPSDPARIGHTFVVPPNDGWPRAAWRLWLLERIGLVDRHEACEWFQERVPERVMAARSEADMWVRPFDPHHDPMQPAYAVRDWVGDA